jgi:hypothetical protein
LPDVAGLILGDGRDACIAVNVHSASEICIEKGQSFQASDFDADILPPTTRDYPLKCLIPRIAIASRCMSSAFF